MNKGRGRGDGRKKGKKDEVRGRREARSVIDSSQVCCSRNTLVVFGFINYEKITTADDAIDELTLIVSFSAFGRSSELCTIYNTASLSTLSSFVYGSFCYQSRRAGRALLGFSWAHSTRHHEPHEPRFPVFLVSSLLRTCTLNRVGHRAPDEKNKVLQVEDKEKFNRLQ